MSPEQHVETAKAYTQQGDTAKFMPEREAAFQAAIAHALTAIAERVVRPKTRRAKRVSR